MAIDFSTKANTLLALHGKLKNAVVLPQVCFTVAQWNSNPEIIIDKIYLMLSGNLVVRSSAYDEDSKTQSLAGKYNSTLNIKNKKDLIAAIRATSLKIRQ